MEKNDNFGLFYLDFGVIDIVDFGHIFFSFLLSISRNFIFHIFL